LGKKPLEYVLSVYTISENAIARDANCDVPAQAPDRANAGNNFQRVLDEARHQMARYYLSNSVLELNETAYLLGFEDPNSFGRAFRTWEGIPPSDWRETHRSSAVSPWRLGCCVRLTVEGASLNGRSSFPIRATRLKLHPFRLAE